MNRQKAFEAGCLVIAALSSGTLIADGNRLLGLLGYLCVFVYMFNHGEGEI